MKLFNELSETWRSHVKSYIPEKLVSCVLMTFETSFIYNLVSPTNWNETTLYFKTHFRKIIRFSMQ